VHLLHAASMLYIFDGAWQMVCTNLCNGPGTVLNTRHGNSHGEAPQGPFWASTMASSVMQQQVGLWQMWRNV
jgi:hypothetical protein